MLGHRGHQKRRIDTGCETGSGEGALGLAVTSEEREVPGKRRAG